MLRPLGITAGDAADGRSSSSPKPLLQCFLVLAVRLPAEPLIDGLFEKFGHRAILLARDLFQRGFPVGKLGEVAAIAVAMVPFLLAAILFSFFGLQRRKWQQGGAD